jgi:recombining binding protein (suppressor of hairless)
MTVSHFFYEDAKTRTQMPLTVYLGGLGPLRARFYQATPPGPLTNISSFGGGTMSGPSNEVVVGGGDGVVGSAADAAPRYLSQPPLHTIVTVELPSLADIIKALEEDVMTPGVMTSDGIVHRHSPQNEHGTPLDGTNGHGSQSHPPPSIAGRNLPLLFIRASDGMGYHSGRTISCENVFQTMELGTMTPGNVLAPSGGAADANWLAAAQAAAAVDGGLHGWTLRVM